MVYVFAADGFEEIELTAPVDLLRRAGARVSVVGITGRAVTGAHGITILSDISPLQVDPDEAEMIVLPGGGRGVANLTADPFVCTRLQKAARANTVIAAICAAPSLLQKLGLLDGRDFTCYPGCEIPSLGGNYTGSPLEVSGRFITSRGPGTAVLFGAALVEALFGGDKAREILAALQAE